MDWSLILAILSLVISGWTFYATRIMKGAVKMTRPNIICFLGPNGHDESKIFIRTLLYSTSEQGQYIQNMFIRLHRAEASQSFNIWAYGDKGTVRGSGLFVNKAGIASYHHFFPPKGETAFSFTAGEYDLEIYVEVVNKKPIQLFRGKFTLTQEQSSALVAQAAIQFDWAPNAQRYNSHIEPKN